MPFAGENDDRKHSVRVNDRTVLQVVHSRPVSVTRRSQSPPLSTHLHALCKSTAFVTHAGDSRGSKAFSV